MSLATDIEIVVRPAAAARVAELGHQEAFQEMLRQAEARVPGLRRVEVDLVPDQEEGADPGIFLHCLVEAHGAESIAGRDSWDRWKLAAFPPQTWRHYSLWTTEWSLPHAG